MKQVAHYLVVNYLTYSRKPSCRSNKSCTARKPPPPEGREGRAVSSDNVLDVKLTTPKELGGNGAVGTNPEQLFAAGYSACFIGALKFVAAATRSSLPADLSIEGKVGIGAIDTGFVSKWN